MEFIPWDLLGFSDMNLIVILHKVTSGLGGDLNKAQQHTDLGIDFLAIIDHQRLVTWPKASL